MNQNNSSVINVNNLSSKAPVVRCVTQGHNKVLSVGIEPRTSRFGVRCPTGSVRCQEEVIELHVTLRWPMVFAQNPRPHCVNSVGPTYTVRLSRFIYQVSVQVPLQGGPLVMTITELYRIK